ncbi:ribonuclease III [Dehalogenimonas sp. WBC-2]|nr:ribonuclease III [Dehalogenimonas sp. WBC-2]
MADLNKLQSRIGVSFKKPAFLELALIHSSYINEKPGIKIESNERLEFLGDAVLGLWIAEKLFHLFPEVSEGVLTHYRSLLVRRGTLARLAETIGLGEYLYLGRGEESSGGRNKPANLARVLEALIAAIYLDQGYLVTGQFAENLFQNDLKNLESLGTEIDYKSKLQEIIQATYHSTPNYTIVESTGVAHHRLFTAQVSVTDLLLGQGQGYSKKEAESKAAHNAILIIKDTLHLDDSLLTLEKIRNEAINMGQRDKGGREQKKTKKDSKKPEITSQFIQPPPPVEVLKVKGKKPRGE